jgi:hypothetical protein
LIRNQTVGEPITNKCAPDWFLVTGYAMIGSRADKFFERGQFTFQLMNRQLMSLAAGKQGKPAD